MCNIARMLNKKTFEHLFFYVIVYLVDFKLYYVSVIYSLKF